MWDRAKTFDLAIRRVCEAAKKNVYKEIEVQGVDDILTDLAQVVDFVTVTCSQLKTKDT